MPLPSGQYVPPSETHSEPIKVRLTPPDNDLLKALAVKSDIPPAVLARTLIRQGLDKLLTPVATSPTDSPSCDLGGGHGNA